jgi:hypothetical protein
MPRSCVRSVSILLCIGLMVSACATNKAIPQPADGQRVEWIRLHDGETVNVRPPNVARWEDDRVVIRDRDKNIVTTLPPEQISEMGGRQAQTGAFLAAGAVVVVVVFALLMTAMDSFGDSWSK